MRICTFRHMSHNVVLADLFRKITTENIRLTREPVPLKAGSLRSGVIERCEARTV